MTRSIDSNTKSGNNFWASKLVLSYPLWKGNLSVGGEYSYNHRTDAYTFQATDAVPVKSTDTEINEKSSAIFLEYGRQFGKLYAQAGLRYEHLTNDYFNFGVKEDEVAGKVYGHVQQCAGNVALIAGAAVRKAEQYAEIDGDAESDYVRKE